jgi:hypothetical protein
LQGDLPRAMSLVCRALADERRVPVGYKTPAELMATTVNGMLAEGPEVLEYDTLSAWSLRAVLEFVVPPQENEEIWPDVVALEGATLVAVLLCDRLENLERPATAEDIRKAIREDEEFAGLLD